MKNKLKVMNEKPVVSDDELEKFMDFDLILVKRLALIKKRKIQYTVGGSVVVVVAVISGWMFLTQDTLKELPVHEVIPESIEPIEDFIISVDSVALEPPKAIETQSKEGVERAKKKVKEQQPTAMNETKNDSAPIYIQSAPTEGYAHLYAYFEKEIIYPAGAIADSIQGTVTVHFIIGKDGKPKNIQVENSLGELFDEEVIRIITNMPSWNPATLNNEPIESKISLPLSFNLKTVVNKE